MNYKVVIIDLDNTLIDFDYMEKCSLKHCLGSFGLPVTQEVINRYVTINQALWDGLELGQYKKSEILTLRFERLLNEFNLNGNPVDMNQTYLGGMANYLKMMDGASELLEYIKDKYTVVMMTNGVTSAQNAKLDKGHLRQYFDHILISDEVGSHKPNVKIFEHMMSLIGHFEKSEMIIIGDSLTSDMQGGINFKIDTCWYNPDKKDSDQKLTYTIEHLSDLLNIL